jgi:small subunit ribosomal protein S17
MPKRVSVGVVTSDKMNKTRRVEIARLVKHPKYGKYVRRRTVCYVHDEEEQSSLGDTVEIIESRPLSKQKRWQLVKVVRKSTAVDVAALRAAGKAGLASNTPVDDKPVDDKPVPDTGVDDPNRDAT